MVITLVYGIREQFFDLRICSETVPNLTEYFKSCVSLIRTETKHLSALQQSTSKVQESTQGDMFTTYTTAPNTTDPVGANTCDPSQLFDSLVDKFGRTTGPEMLSFVNSYISVKNGEHSHIFVENRSTTKDLAIACSQ